MKKYLFLYAVVVTALLVGIGRTLHKENNRLKNNQTSLTQQVEHYRTARDEAVASVQALRLRCSEYEQMRRADADHIKSLGLRIRRLESVSKSVAVTEFSAGIPLRDTVILRDTVVVHDTLPAPVGLRRFRWSDEWVEVCGEIAEDTLHCTVRSIDTLRQIVHRVPRRFLFIRYGTKAIRQEICSSNPHTDIVYADYVEIERRRPRRR